MSGPSGQACGSGTPRVNVDEEKNDETYVLGGIHKVWINRDPRYFSEMEVQFFDDDSPRIVFKISGEAFARLKLEAESKGLCRKEKYQL